MPLISDPFGGRDVEEWIGSSPNARVPDRIRDRVFFRAKGICHISGRKIVVPRDRAPDVKNVVQALKQEGRRELI